MYSISLSKHFILVSAYNYFSFLKEFSFGVWNFVKIAFKAHIVAFLECYPRWNTFVL